jgi:hypothetical protein
MNTTGASIYLSDSYLSFDFFHQQQNRANENGKKSSFLAVSMDVKITFGNVFHSFQAR